MKKSEMMDALVKETGLTKKMWKQYLMEHLIYLRKNLKKETMSR